MTYRFEGREYRWKSLEDFLWGEQKDPYKGLGYDQLNQEDFVLLEKQLGHALPALLKELYKVSNGSSPYYSIYPILDTEGYLKHYVEFYQLETMNQHFYNEYFLGDFDTDPLGREERRWPLGVLALNRVAEHECVGLDYRKCNEKGEPSVVFVTGYPLKDVDCDESLSEGFTEYYLYHLEDSFEDFMSKLLTEEEIKPFIQESPYGGW